MPLSERMSISAQLMPASDSTSISNQLMPSTSNPYMIPFSRGPPSRVSIAVCTTMRYLMILTLISMRFEFKTFVASIQPSVASFGTVTTVTELLAGEPDL